MQVWVALITRGGVPDDIRVYDHDVTESEVMEEVGMGVTDDHWVTICGPLFVLEDR